MHLSLSDPGLMQLGRPHRNSTQASPPNSGTPLLDQKPLPSDPRRRVQRSSLLEEAVTRWEQHLCHQTFCVSGTSQAQRVVYPTHSVSHCGSVCVCWTSESISDFASAQQDQKSRRLCVCWHFKCPSCSVESQPYTENRNTSVCWIKKYRTVGVTKWYSSNRSGCVFWFRWSWNLKVGIYGFAIFATVYLSRFISCKYAQYTRVGFRNYSSWCIRRFSLCESTAFVKQQNRCNTRTSIGTRTTCPFRNSKRESHFRCPSSRNFTIKWSRSSDCSPQSFPLRLSHPRIVGRSVGQWQRRRVPSEKLLHLPVRVQRTANGELGHRGYWSLPRTSNAREPRSVEGDVFSGREGFPVLPAAYLGARPKVKGLLLSPLVFQSVCARYVPRSECIRDTCKTISA